ncbi:MAG: hypothetical protein HC814_02455 [Rhodobacteraceae bacterium]|nr:hypothetical protein [Paracoccaceae bacterium]
MLRDDPVIEVFESPERPPDWIEAIDIENGEYQFCDEHGQRYVGVITRPPGWFRAEEFLLRPEGSADLNNVLALIDRAELIEPSNRFPDLEALRKHVTEQAKP